MAQSYLDKAGLGILWNKIKALIPAASSTTPNMDGVANAGSETTWAKGDHVHPSDTSRVPTTRTVNGKALSSDVTLTGDNIAVSSSDSTKISTVLNTTLNTISIIDDVGENIDITPEQYHIEILGGTGIDVLAHPLSAEESGTPYLTISTNGEPNVLEGVQMNGTDLTITNKKVNITNLIQGQGYAVCSTAAATVAKTATLTDYKLVTYGIVAVKFTNGIGVAGATLNINNTGAKPIYVFGSAVTSNSIDVLKSGRTGIFMYDGSAYQLIGLDSSIITGVLQSGTSNAMKIEFQMASPSGGRTSVSAPLMQNGKIGVDTLPEVTTSTNGAMSASDKSKLDSITMSNGKIDASILPSYVDDVIEAYPRSGQTALSAAWLSTTSGGSALTPETGKIYILMSASGDYGVNSQFRWSGSTYVEMSNAGVSAITETEINAICI